MNRNNIIKLLNKSPYKIYGAFAGCGQDFVYSFLNESGASNTIAGFNFPYSREAFNLFVGMEDANDIKYASIHGANLLALNSINQFDSPNRYNIGIGVSASLASDNEREGRTHKIHVSIANCDAPTESILMTQYSIEDIPQATYTRVGEDEMATEMIFKILSVKLFNLPYGDEWLEELESLSKVTYNNTNSI